ncbi:UNVERIFIED_CONTAM: Copia protein [Sesamum calycinum]|uniref:Copia protein n=1 Tax=Sesamum calycinum TaxID=2727403 RepID=A0AAW2KFH7_9LAMI
MRKRSAFRNSITFPLPFAVTLAISSGASALWVLPCGAVTRVPSGEKQHSCRLSGFAFSEFRCIESWVRHAMRRRRGSKKRVSENNALHGCYLDPTKVSPELVRTKQEDWLHLPSEEGHVGKQACARTNQDPRDLSMEGLLTDSETESSDLDWYTGSPLFFFDEKALVDFLRLSKEEFALQRGRTLLPLTKGFTLKEGIDYTETFSPVSNKDSLRIIMALVAHFYLELHQMDVKTAFLNGDLQGGSVHGPTFWLLAGGQRAFSVQIKEVDIRTSLPISGILIRNFEMKDMGEPHMSWALRFTWPLFSSTAAILEYQIESKISLSYVGSPFAGVITESYMRSLPVRYG